MTLDRRTFLEKTAAVAAAGFLPRSAFPDARAWAPLPRAGRVCVVASSNGLRGVKLAYDRILAGTDTLDAIIAGVNITELDPTDQSVGLGGLPNADGVVQLDASCMHGPTNRAGSVGCIEEIATPSLVAKAVMDYTAHVMLVGEGAKKFALAMGFRPQNLLTEQSRQDWLRWKANLNPGDAWLDRRDDVKINFTHGTINMNAVNAAGDVSSVTTTSGWSYKIPGRLGDSPIIGAGQYTDNAVGAAGSTGQGELCIKACASFYIVEQMRLGKSPEQACLAAMERVMHMTEARWLDGRGRPKYDVNFYAVAKDGRFGGASLYQGGEFAVCDADGARVVKSAYLYPNSERPRE
ncbi:MAG: N(4)-(beta-N-acetylglucosaminyl)-L-asparaginase [Gemmatimonadaceae bacterium]|nr:N(4)-(beta-N-acetylglucosaminyl)-L-asparaginase [Gemmatimonadaceae bacterium]